MPQDWQRYILLLGLAAVAYLLVLKWNDDYGGVSGTNQGGDVPELATQQTHGDMPTGIVATETTGDVPDISLVGEATNDVAASQTTARQGQAVQVRTGVLEFWIDPVGGDVVRVRLPSHPLSLETPDIPFPLMDRGNGRVYIAQSGLIGAQGVDQEGGRAQFDAQATEYETVVDRELEVVLRMRPKAGLENLRVEKVFRFKHEAFLVDVEYRVYNQGQAAAHMNLYAQFKHDGRPALAGESGGLGPRPYVGAALQTSDDRYYKLEFEDMDEGPFRARLTGGWVAMLQHYFLGAWVPNAEQLNTYLGRKTSDGRYTVGYIGPERRVEPGETAVLATKLYVGPKNQKRLEEIAPDLNLTVDYGFLWWLAVPLFWLLDWLHGYVGNWGGAIILLTLLVKLVLYPLSNAGYKSMAKMRQVAPKMKQLQERYADDRQKLSAEMMQLYKREGANPMGGCIPMLLPMPVFIALYWVLFESVELRQAPFALWIQDLSEIDPYFVLPILMGASMFGMQYLSPPPAEPMQARIMKAMPIAFTVLFLFFPAGLVLYWLANNVLSLAQQWYITRKIEAQAANK